MIHVLSKQVDFEKFKKKFQSFCEIEIYKESLIIPIIILFHIRDT